ncbi:exodeoxyribonuclease VII small subunit [Aurantivibrio infirmus]
MAGKTKQKPVDFEKSLSQLEALVNKLEAGDLSLEDSLQAFEEGVKLTRECQSRLVEAEQRVQILVEQQGELVSEDFDTEDEPEE